MWSGSARIEHGLATFDERQLQVLRHLDEAILDHARTCGMNEIGFPPLSAVSDLDRIDYFRNFPHLGLAVAPLQRSKLSNVPIDRNGRGSAVAAQALEDVGYLLPSAACYPAYAHLRDMQLAGPQRVTTVAQCFRNEEQYNGMERLWAFRMREFVIVALREEVRQFLAWQKAWIADFAQGAGLALSTRVATDPFFESTGDKAAMQQLFPVKEEFVYENTVAVSSVNFHRNFFGERWNIKASDGKHAFSGCVAFGLERWLHALSRRYGDDCEDMLRAIDAGAVRAAWAYDAARPRAASSATDAPRTHS